MKIPGLKGLKKFAGDFKSDFDCWDFDSPSTSSRPHQRPRAITFDGARNDNQVEGSSRIIKRSYTTTDTTSISISNPVKVKVDSPQPMIASEILAQEHESLASNSVVTASPTSSTSHVSFISEASEGDDAVDSDSCTETAGGTSLAASLLETESEEDASSETADSEDTVQSDYDRPRHLIFKNCQNVYVNSHNAQGVKVENAGNHTPQVAYNIPSSSRSSTSSYHSERYRISRYDFTRYTKPPPMLPPLSFPTESLDSSSNSTLLAGPSSDRSTAVPPVTQATTSSGNSSLIYDDDTNLGRHSPKKPVLKLPGPDSRFPPFTTKHRPFSQASTSSQDPNSESEQRLKLALENFQKKLQSGSLSPQEQDILLALGSTETPVTSGARPSNARTTSICDTLYSCESYSSI